MDSNVKNLFTICCHTYRINHLSCGAETFPDLIPLLKVDRFEGFLNHIKIDGMVNNYLSGCNV